MPPDRAGDLRAALATSSRLATEVDAVLGRYEAGLDRVLKADGVRQTVERTQALRAARAEVRAALADAELTLHHLDTPRRVEAAVLAGPEADLPAFLRALADLGGATAFLDPRKGDLPAAEAAVDSAEALRRDGLALALRNFVTLLQLHRGDGEEEEDEEEAGGEGGGGRWRPSEEGVPGGEEEADGEAAASAAAATTLDYDSEDGSEADGGGDHQAAAAAATDDNSSPFLRVADFVEGAGGGAAATGGGGMPPPVRARLRALADVMMAAGNAAPCVKAYCDVRRAHLDTVLQALQAPVPLSAGAGENSELGVIPGSGSADASGWVDCWSEAIVGLARTATSERDLAAAVFDDTSHAAEAAASVFVRLVDLVVAAGQGMIATRRNAPKLMSLLTMMAAFGPALDSLDAVLGMEQRGHLLGRLRDMQQALRTETRACFAEFLADLGRSDSWKGVTAACSVLPLVVQTVARLEDLLKQTAVFSAVCAEMEAGAVAKCGETAVAPPPASALILRVLDALLAGLDAKAKASKSRAGAILLTLNNVQYLVSAVAASPALAACVPGDCLAGWRGQVEDALRDLRATLWAPLVELLGSDRPSELSKESAKSLTSALQVVDEARSVVAITDDDLRARVRDAVTAEVVEPYELLLTTAEPALLKHLHYSAADVRSLVEDAQFFVLRDDAAGGGGGARAGGSGLAGGGGGASFKRR